MQVGGVKTPPYIGYSKQPDNPQFVGMVAGVGWRGIGLFFIDMNIFFHFDPIRYGQIDQLAL